MEQEQSSFKTYLTLENLQTNLRLYGFEFGVGVIAGGILSGVLMTIVIGAGVALYSKFLRSKGVVEDSNNGV